MGTTVGVRWAPQAGLRRVSLALGISQAWSLWPPLHVCPGRVQAWGDQGAPQLCPWHSPASPASSERGPALYAGSTCRCPLGRWWDRGPGGEGGGAPPCRSRPRARGARRSGCTESSGLVWPRGWRGPRPSALDQKRVRRRRAPPAGPGTRSPALPAAPAYGRAATGEERLSQSKREERERIQAPAPHAPRMLQSLLGPFALTTHLLCPQTRQGRGGTRTRSHLSRHPQRRARCASPVSAAASVCPHVCPCVSVPLSVPPPPLPPGRPPGSPVPATVPGAHGNSRAGGAVGAWCRDPPGWGCHVLTSTGGHSAACQTSQGRPCQQGTVAGGQGAPPVTVAGVVRQATAMPLLKRPRKSLLIPSFGTLGCVKMRKQAAWAIDNSNRTIRESLGTLTAPSTVTTQAARAFS